MSTGGLPQPEWSPCKWSCLPEDPPEVLGLPVLVEGAAAGPAEPLGADRALHAVLRHALLVVVRDLVHVERVLALDGLWGGHTHMTSMYRVTIPLVQNLPLTSKQMFRFGLARPG